MRRADSLKHRRSFASTARPPGRRGGIKFPEHSRSPAAPETCFSRTARGSSASRRAGPSDGNIVVGAGGSASLISYCRTRRYRVTLPILTFFVLRAIITYTSATTCRIKNKNRKRCCWFEPPHESVRFIYFSPRGQRCCDTPPPRRSSDHSPRALQSIIPAFRVVHTVRTWYHHRNDNYLRINNYGFRRLCM